MQRRDEGGSFGVKTSKVNRTGSRIMEADYVGMIKKEKRDKEGSLRERIRMIKVMTSIYISHRE